MSYYDTILRYDWETTRRAIYAKNDADVERALAAERPTMDDFAALVSPAADKYLGEMASKSYATTRRRFGNVMQLYVPLYLANICQNHCVYCGFNCTNKIHRRDPHPGRDSRRSPGDQARPVPAHPARDGRGAAQFERTIPGRFDEDHAAVLRADFDRGAAARHRRIPPAERLRPARSLRLPGDLQPRPLPGLPPARQEDELPLPPRDARPPLRSGRAQGGPGELDRARGLAHRRPTSRRCTCATWKTATGARSIRSPSRGCGPMWARTASTRNIPPRSATYSS